MNNKGSAGRDALLILGLLFGLLLLWFIISVASRDSGAFVGTFRSDYLVPSMPGASESSFVFGVSDDVVIDEYDPAQAGRIVTIDGQNYIRSPYYGQISIGRGNARSTYQPREEYITLSTSWRNREPIDITGWLLENGDGNKLQRIGSSTFVEGRAVRVAIPQATSLLVEGQAPILGPVVLQPGGRAIITTGSLSVSGFTNTSFRVNKCSGYMENMSGFGFEPRLSRDCPRADSGPGASRLEDACFNYLSRLSRCHIPETEPYVVRDPRDGNYVVSRHLDRQTGFSNQCFAYVATYLSYNGCVRQHFNDEDFFQNEWRIYLNRPFEMWGESREVITLYDNYGRLVDQLKY